jgi:hypothetical protein
MKIGCIDMTIVYIDTKICYIDTKIVYSDNVYYIGTKIGYSDKKIGYIDTKIGYSENIGYIDTKTGYSEKKIGYIDTKIGYSDKICYIDTKIGCSDKKIGYVDMKIAYNNKLIYNILSTKFIELTIDSTLSCRMHIDHLTAKLSNACYVIRSIRPLISHKHYQLFISVFFTQSWVTEYYFGKSLSQYTNFSDAKESNQNFYGLWE